MIGWYESGPVRHTIHRCKKCKEIAPIVSIQERNGGLVWLWLCLRHPSAGVTEEPWLDGVAEQEPADGAVHRAQRRAILKDTD